MGRYNDPAVIEAHDVYDRLLDARSKDDVAEIMVGVSFGAFVELDERPGQFGNYAVQDWPVWLRQLRNDPTSTLFDNLTRERNPLDV